MPAIPPPASDLPPHGFLMPSSAVQNDLPLQGVTLLAVEDSRFACEALRLMAMRAGARLRRAETLKAARDHLRVYRPDVVIIDLGLPDGRGEALIRELVAGEARPKLVLGTSGNPDGKTAALAAGADGFIDKPLNSLAEFCDALRSHLPGIGQPRPASAEIAPDFLALQDDLAHAARRLEAEPDPVTRRYVTGFLHGIARHAHDEKLAQAAVDAAQPAANWQDLRQLIGERLAAGSAAFAPSED
jgi:DNA-binding response OmpR family regulator